MAASAASCGEEGSGRPEMHSECAATTLIRCHSSIFAQTPAVQPIRSTGAYTEDASGVIAEVVQSRPTAAIPHYAQAVRWMTPSCGRMIETQGGRPHVGKPICMLGSAVVHDAPLVGRACEGYQLADPRVRGSYTRHSARSLHLPGSPSLMVSPNSFRHTPPPASRHNGGRDRHVCGIIPGPDNCQSAHTEAA